MKYHINKLNALLIIVFIMLSVYTVWLQIDPRQSFFLRGEDIIVNDHVAEDERVLVNKKEFEPGDHIYLRFKYRSEEEQNIRVDLVLRDGIRVDGASKILPVYKGEGTVWLDAFEIPSITYSSEYVVEVYISYKENPLRTTEIETETVPFNIINEDTYYLSEFDPVVPKF